MDQRRVARRKIRNDLPVLIVFGIDHRDRPRAGWFAYQDIDMAVNMAQQLKLRIFSIDGPKHMALARKIPVGQISASGYDFMGIVQPELLGQLSAVANALGVEPPADRTIPSLSDEELVAVGPLKAEEILEINRQMSVHAGERKIYERIPASWDEIRTFSLVLANKNDSEGWREALVWARRGNILFLRWRYSDGPLFVRHLSTVALLKPSID
jgi:hypothetical protein